MLIPCSFVKNVLENENIHIKGVFHVGAHHCEELNDYMSNFGISSNNIIWVEGNKDIAKQIKNNGIPNVFNALIDEVSGNTVDFNITNNGQSSSILNFGTHSKHHPHVVVSKTEKYITTSIKDLVKENAIEISNFNLWAFDIQGAELKALKGAGDLLLNVDALYLEVNTENVYQDCPLVNEIDEYVSKYGFIRTHTSMTEYGWGDALYVKRM